MSSLPRRIQIRKMQKMGYHRGKDGLIHDSKGDVVGEHYPLMLKKEEK